MVIASAGASAPVLYFDFVLVCSSTQVPCTIAVQSPATLIYPARSFPLSSFPCPLLFPRPFSFPRPVTLDASVPASGRPHARTLIVRTYIATHLLPNAGPTAARHTHASTRDPISFPTAPFPFPLPPFLRSFLRSFVFAPAFLRAVFSVGAASRLAHNVDFRPS
ncbi:hypothetical protein HYPSUDRAFT_371966 [Hypholoma sublateritium FD-334 SS-4]|uniref:Uncharacterized protein n=1 Tax=Hypholoma sublateritium (strain FD-334 SS-4) TaxID=945553 RepID=A0A0D2P4L2_HYPSF|nr:hypothetical protein HYPSUDRAFT_371966 [Hypholoma sublateritium FD-334 SS-4]